MKFPPINLWSLPKQFKDYMLVSQEYLEGIMVTESRHAKFAAYWESIGKPELEYRFNDCEWVYLGSPPVWDQEADFRIKGDLQWWLRRKWIDSDFTLPIEVFDTHENKWRLMNKKPAWNFDCSYREAKQQVGDSFDNEENRIIKTLSERGARYGSFSDLASVSCGIKKIIQAQPGFANLSSSQSEALDMIASKIGRIINGDPNYADSWHDIAGYATLIEQELANEAKS